MNAWRWIRVILVAAFFAAGLLTDSQAVISGYPLWKVAAVAFTIGVFGMVFIIGIQAYNPHSAPQWSYPGWHKNPFTMREPLQFFHFGGYLVFASGLGGLLRHFFGGSGRPAEAVGLTSWGMGLLIGVWLCCLLFRRKMVLE